MTALEFHTGLPDPIDYACRMLRKAQRQGWRVLVIAPEATVAELDTLLWTFDNASFVPHVRLPSAQAALTPIWLCTAVPEGEGEDHGNVPPLLINLGASIPEQPARFERLIELVGLDVDEAEAGRERWRAYKAQGFAVIHRKPGQNAHPESSADTDATGG